MRARSQLTLMQALIARECYGLELYDYAIVVSTPLSPPLPSPFRLLQICRVGKYRLSENYVALDSLHLVSLADGPKERRDRWTVLYMLQITLNLGSSFLLLNNMRALICRCVY
jgi:hypothetical protein